MRQVFHYLRLFESILILIFSKIIRITSVVVTCLIKLTLMVARTPPRAWCTRMDAHGVGHRC
jgi:hypothetical protein